MRNGAKAKNSRERVRIIFAVQTRPDLLDQHVGHYKVNLASNQIVF